MLLSFENRRGDTVIGSQRFFPTWIWPMALILTVALGGCAGIAVYRSETELEGVIFSKGMLKHCAPRSLAPFWTPSRRDVLEAEGKLLLLLEVRGDAVARDLSWRVLRSKRQYIGYTDDGRRVMRINFLCDRLWLADAQWKSVPLLNPEADGCIVSVRWDAEANEIDSTGLEGELNNSNRGQGPSNNRLKLAARGRPAANSRLHSRAAA